MPCYNLSVCEDDKLELYITDLSSIGRFTMPYGAQSITLKCKSGMVMLTKQELQTDYAIHLRTRYENEVIAGRKNDIGLCFGDKITIYCPSSCEQDIFSIYVKTKEFVNKP
jgi:hypothetical protein